MTAAFRIVAADFSTPNAQALVKALDDYLAQQYSDYEPNRYGLRAGELTAPGSGFWLAYCRDRAIGCVALRPFTSTVVELKRLYVQPEFRRQGVGSALLRTAEAAAIAHGYLRIWLETGDAQPDSIRLYLQRGFQAIPCFGPYDDPASCCYEKRLPASPASLSDKSRPVRQ